MNFLGRWVVRHARLIVVAWVLLGVVGVFFAPQTLQRLTGGGGELPGSESAAVDRTLHEHFVTPLASRLLVVLETKAHTVDAPDVAPLVEQVGPVLRALPSVAAVEGPLHRGDVMGGEPGAYHRTWVVGLRTGEALNAQNAVREVRAAVLPLRTALAGADPEALLAITGGSAVNEDIGQRSKQDGQRAEMLATPLTMLVLWLAFRTAGAAVLPLVCAGFAIVLTFGLAFVVTSVTPLSDLMENLVTMVGLAVGVDYALLMVERWRHERQQHAPIEAVAHAVTHAAPAILVSALAVLCGMVGLVFAPLLELRSMAFGGVSVVLFALLAAITLLPAVLVLGARWVEWPTGLAAPAAEARSQQRWARLAETVVAKPWRFALSGSLLLALLMAPAFTFQTGAPRMTDFPADMESNQGIAALGRMGAGNQVFALPVIVETTDGSPVLARQHLGPLHRWVRELEADDRTLRVLGPLSLRPQMSSLAVAVTWQDWRKGLARFPDVQRLFVSTDGTRMLMTVIPRSEVSTIAVQAMAAELQKKWPEGPYRVRVGGQPTYLNELEGRLADAAVPVLGSVALLTALLLGWSFRSVLVPIKAILLNLLSVGAGFGVMTLVCQWGWGAAWVGLAEPLVRVPPFVPLLMFCIMFGLSMDYEVFMLSRIRERLRLHGDQRRAIVEGLAATGPVITQAAAVMVIVFGAFGLADILVVKVVGIGLATAVLVDALLLRTLLAAPLLLLAGRWNWYPGTLSRAVPSSTAAQEQAS
jgi:putative drug exporter of the RND superfamily